ncbi:MAG TPA: four helix bundle protein [Candidatus Sulfotelmatobacter sp.]|nr:four helix bundle protein [Candidatus Sulfotelmatobacter sp.]
MEDEKKFYGHRKMRVWQNLDKIEYLVRNKILPLIPKNKYSLIDQIDRSCGSSMANFIEGYYSGSLKEYLRFLSYSRRSTAELQDWVRRSHYDGFIKQAEYLEFDDLAIKTVFLINRLVYALKKKAVEGKQGQMKSEGNRGQIRANEVIEG